MNNDYRYILRTHVNSPIKVQYSIYMCQLGALLQFDIEIKTESRIKMDDLTIGTLPAFDMIKGAYC